MTAYLRLDPRDIAIVVLRAAKDAIDAQVAQTTATAKRLAPVRRVFDEQRLGKLAGGRQRRHIVPLTATQLNAEANIRARIGLGPRTINVAGKPVVLQSVYPGETGYRRVQARTVASEYYVGRTPTKAELREKRLPPNWRTVARKPIDEIRQGDLRKLRYAQAENYLTSRGRYELRSGRALSALDTGRSVRRPELSGLGYEGVSEKTIPVVHVTLGGRLRNEITAVPAEFTGTYELSGYVRSPTPYAKYVEFGTMYAPAQPFMRPAASMARRQFRSRLRTAISHVSRRSGHRRL